jgi:decaprenylphospho-beta-D-erythro-pentofuranosid-2-ulose 2-reductase
MTRIVALGALSDIAAATLRRYAGAGVDMILFARDETRLERLADDLRVRGAAVRTVAGDLADPDAPAALEGLGEVDLFLLAYGVLGDQRALERDLRAAHALIEVNFASAALWCLAAANVLERQGRGTLAVIGSVAGDRGRQSNYLYGATKAGLATLVEGLDHRLSRRGARALLVKPGFVDTAMTAHLGAKGPLWASADRVGAIIQRSVARGRAVTYAPGFWRYIMTVIGLLPRPIFHRTQL